MSLSVILFLIAFVLCCVIQDRTVTTQHLEIQKYKGMNQRTGQLDHTDGVKGIRCLGNLCWIKKA